VLEVGPLGGQDGIGGHDRATLRLPLPYRAAMEIALLAVGALSAGLLVRALRRRRDGWYADGDDPPATDARGAVDRNSWMLGGGGGGGGG